MKRRPLESDIPEASIAGWKPVELKKAVNLVFWQRFKRDGESTARKTSLFISNDSDPLPTISEHRVFVYISLCFQTNSSSLLPYKTKSFVVFLSC